LVWAAGIYGRPMFCFIFTNVDLRAVHREIYQKYFNMDIDGICQVHPESAIL
jgi:hypothetical protein